MNKQPFKICKDICGNEPCHSRGMCYAQMHILEKVEQQLTDKYNWNDIK